MSRKRILKTGLDELMIVNPREPLIRSGGQMSSDSQLRYFLGEDGTLYQLVGSEGDTNPYVTNSFTEGTLFLGEDGHLYIYL